MQNKTRKILRLAAAAVREREAGKDRFKKSGEAAAELRALGIPFGTKIGPLPQHKRGPRVPEFVTLVDHFAAKEGEEVTHAYRPARFDRYSIEEWKEPKAQKAPAPETT
jgi:hypothetical protein